MPLDRGLDNFPYYEAHGLSILALANREWAWPLGRIENALVVAVASRRSRAARWSRHGAASPRRSPVARASCDRRSPCSPGTSPPRSTPRSASTTSAPGSRRTSRSRTTGSTARRATGRSRYLGQRHERRPDRRPRRPSSGTARSRRSGASTARPRSGPTRSRPISRTSTARSGPIRRPTSCWRRTESRLSVTQVAANPAANATLVRLAAPSDCARTRRASPLTAGRWATPSDPTCPRRRRTTASTFAGRHRRPRRDALPRRRSARRTSACRACTACASDGSAAGADKQPAIGGRPRPIRLRPGLRLADRRPPDARTGRGASRSRPRPSSRARSIRSDAGGDATRARRAVSASGRFRS